MKQLITLLLVFTCFSLHPQSINGEFELTNLNSSEDRLSTYFDENSRLFFSDSILSVSNAARVYEFSFQLKNDSLLLSNSKNNFAFFVNYRNHELSLKNDYSSLSLSKIKQEPITSNLQEAAQEKEIIPNQNFTLEGFYRGVIGIFSILLLSFLFSANKRAINWKTVGVGLAAQLILAIGVLKVPFVQAIFEFVGKIFVKILDFTAEGSEFLLGDLMNVDSYGFIFLFQILPTIIFFSALTSLLFYLGVIQVVVKGMAWILTKLMNISGAEGLSVAGNIFLGQTESPLMIKAYLEKMTKSEILLVMIGGMATVAGGVLAAYIGFLGDGDPAKRLEFARHLLAASVMAAPGAIVVSKILYPQQEKIQRTAEVSQEKIGSNILDAISNGTSEGLRLAANVGAMLLVFIAFIALINYSLESFGNLVGLNSIIAQNSPYNSFSLESILGFIFAPVMWLIGVPKEDVMLMGQLLGIKLAASEFVGYIQLAELKNPANLLSLNYQKSVIMATYMLCGFANFASIGIQIGGIGSLAPGKRKLLSEFGMKALIGGTFASLLSATIAGMIIG
ncbi:NupC/NupG family nucleoside CNT transporter [Psychroflexus maritimus]|uniref:Na+ dependent nucleoside transporter n=1 Tax=Psychroflexus maritimus TaxID=2714865 RepID=A0A967AKV7_9FLAO|nr:nucleoside transporter C-terminal domain-containing protein [Psychroflexus maritimus]NGZ90164.1 Na+ dependent nucleoside transporter [Psychroflexus maritimus]